MENGCLLTFLGMREEIALILLKGDGKVGIDKSSIELMQAYADGFRNVFAHFLKPGTRINIGCCNLFDFEMAVYFWLVDESEYEPKVKVRYVPFLGMPKTCALAKTRLIRTETDIIRVYTENALFIVKRLNKSNWSSAAGHTDAKEELGELLARLPEGEG
ncbi:MAG TPA: hypothetical protein VMW50_09055 [Dehalococcoidia bacterium]|nr:hypothetical protein [Dehalococcoidia bacterium]